MLASVSFVFGILLAIGIVFVIGRRKPGALGWCTLALGGIAVIALVLATSLDSGGTNVGLPFYLISIAGAAAALPMGGVALKRLARRWPTWVGLALGLIPAIFWIVFALGHVFGPGE
ncbi:hypothetical protein FDZ74_01850 [bacterium]|nr:MAG: hypothetical protein FDZ74_01850 [bacterium]